MRRALSGVRVLEFGGGVAPSYCGKLFADLGADVTLVEQRSGNRFGGVRRDGRVLHLHTNKRSVSVDPADSDDRSVVTSLLQRADLVIESQGSGSLQDWGASWDQLHEQHPSLSVVHISGFGVTGPYSSYAWDDIVVQAASGVMLMQGRVDQNPLKLPGHAGLHLIGHIAALGGLSAVMGAADGQPGCFVDCSAVEALASAPTRQTFLLGYQYRGHQPRPPEPTGATLIPSGIFPCSDGYLGLFSTPQQLAPMLEVLGDPEAKAAFERPDAYERPETKEILDVALYTWLAARTREQAVAEAQRVGWPLCGVYFPAELLDVDHLHQRDFWVHTDDPEHGSIDIPGPWCRFQEGGWALRRLAPRPGENSEEITGPLATDRPADTTLARSSRTTARPPLDGIRVVDLTIVWSGPYATMFLADLGAEVIRVENPFVFPPTTKGYHPRPVLNNPGALGSLYGPARPGGPDRPWNRHSLNNPISRNKLSVTMDTRIEAGRELLMQLAEKSDVLIDNFKADGLERIRIDIAELRKRNPRLIVVRMPPAGLTGDWSSYQGFGAQFDALSGFSSVCGHLDSDPTTTPTTMHMDAASGPGAAFAVLAALRYRAHTGRGQIVEVPQMENLIQHLGDMFVDSQLGVEARRLGNRDRDHAPQGLYPCIGAQEWLAISVCSDDAWEALTQVIGAPELATDARFADAVSRREHHGQLDQLISAWTSSQVSTDAFHRLQQAGVAAAPLMDDAKISNDANLAARGWFRPLESGDVGTHLHPGWAFSGVPQVWKRGSPTLGEDNEYVYKKILGVSDEEYRRYENERMLATDYLKPDGTAY